MGRTYAVGSVIDVAVWLMDRARADNAYLQPRALGALLFLVQGGFGAQFQGRRLMPAVFFVDADGVFDPNVRRVFEWGRPRLTLPEIPSEVEFFLRDVWMRYGQHEPDDLQRLVRRAPEIQEALAAARTSGETRRSLPFATVVRACAFMAAGRFRRRVRSGEDWNEADDTPQDARGGSVAQEDTVRGADGREYRRWRPRARSYRGSVGDGS